VNLFVKVKMKDLTPSFQKPPLRSGFRAPTGGVSTQQENIMKKSLVIGIFGLFIAYAAASPYITIYQIKSAVDAKDGESLSEHIDFPSVRQSLKDQMNAVVMEKMQSEDMKSNPFAALGMAFAGTMVDKMVEAYVTPAGISKLMSGENPSKSQDKNNSNSAGFSPQSSNKKKAFEDVSMGYKSLSKFEVSGKKHGEDSARFILRRNGLEWQLTEIILPKTP